MRRDRRPSMPPMMITLNRPPPGRTLGRDAMLLALTWAAGSVDAISYLSLGHVFTAMMTGNTVLLGLALAQGEILAAVRSIVALLGFALGVALGALIVERDETEEEWPAPVTAALVVEGFLLAVFAAAWHWTGAAPGGMHFSIVLLGAAMGVQAAAVRRLGVPGIATTYITGPVTSLFVDLVVWTRSSTIRPPAPAGETAGWEQRVGLLAGVFFVYGLGAFSGAVLEAHRPSLAAAAPLIAVGLVAANAWVRYRPRRF